MGDVVIGGVEPFAVAGAIGFLLGFEREHHAWVQGEESGAIGTRTFTLIALSGALSGTVSTAVVAVGLMVLGIIVAVSYWRTSEVHRGTTTEVSAMIAFLLGAYCQRDVAVAAGIAVAVALLLEQKSRVHHLLRDVVTDVELDDALRYFAMTLVVLPLLPDRNIDRWGVINPNHLWRLVVMLAGIGWIGYVGTRVFGPRRGLVVVGAASGFISASAATAVLGRMTRQSPELARSALAGALAASVSTCVQIVVIVSVVDKRVGLALAAPMTAAALVLVVEVWVLSRGRAKVVEATQPTMAAADAVAGDEQHPVPSPLSPQAAQRRPLQLRASLAIAAVITVTALVSKLMADRFGSAAAVVTTAVAGLADAHGAALGAMSLIENSGLSEHSALMAVGAALISNSVVKVVLAHIAGGRAFGARFVLGMLAPATVAAVGFVLVNPYL